MNVIPRVIFLLALAAPASHAEPRIGGFTPQTGTIGTLVKIVGIGLDSVVSVRFHDVEAESVRIVSGTHIKAVVPRRATSGFIEAVTPTGTAVSAYPFVVEPGGGNRLAFAFPRPNPARGMVAWRFSLTRPGEACVTVFGVGQGAVRRLCGSYGLVGVQELSWDGRDQSSRRVPAGIYFGVLEAEGRRLVRRVVVVR